VLPGGRDVTLRTGDDLELAAWFFPADGSDEAAERAPAVLFAPGNGGNRGGRIPLAEALTERGLSVLLLEYRGYGGNPGNPTEEGLALDARAAHDYLVDEGGVDSDRMLYFGESLGCGVVSELATERPPAGLLLRSPFTDLPDAAKAHYPFLPVRALLKDRFPVADNVASLTGVEVTVVYGSDDTIVPTEWSSAVADSAGGERVEVAKADHNDPALLYGQELIEATVALARRAAA
jgi:fermentation-respiration switch protein FrsA (DUF1100 family)